MAAAAPSIVQQMPCRGVVDWGWSCSLWLMTLHQDPVMQLLLDSDVRLLALALCGVAYHTSHIPYLRHLLLPREEHAR